MIKRETFLILSKIRQYYDGFEVDQNRVDAFHEVLKHEDYEEVNVRLLEYVRQSPYPPKLADLVQKESGSARAIPGCEETAILLQNQSQPAQEHVVRAELQKMRQILGIGKDG
ncbi:hypothetical protein V1498_20520 [Peribacillus sp. SCS-26]|uniref:hypothetical protein n=1 Tax=Paraperibacillus marinus TaxID=3115295 RepID=UPI003906230D